MLTANPDVSARMTTAVAAMQGEGAKVAEARARLQTIRQAGGWEARYQEGDAERALARAEEGYERARAEHAAARAAEREHLRRQFLPRKRMLVAQVDAALETAAAVNAQLVDLEAREREVVGNHTDQWWSWSELVPSTPMSESRLDVWRRCAREHGLLDEQRQK